MEPKELVHTNCPLHTGPDSPSPFHLHSNTFALTVEEKYNPDSSVSSPGSTSQSPANSSYINRPGSTSTIKSDSREPETLTEPPSDLQTSSLSPSISKTEKEKRKRSRVTPDQLVHLERFFSVDRSPTASRRREISELLGMQERQTQIWFQNRRAKAKLQDGKSKGSSANPESPPDTPPDLSPGFEVDLHNLLHEDQPVTIIPCTDLSIGTWRRIATTVGKYDLVAYICESKQCLTWFIHVAGNGYKMEIPFDIIVDTEFTNAAPGHGLVSFFLNQPPIFYFESPSSPRPDGTVFRHWKRCKDWTEGDQATKVLKHNLIGSAVQLAHLLRNLRPSGPRSDIPLHPPPYQDPSPSPMELPPPPMAGLSDAGYSFNHDTLNVRSVEDADDGHGRKRSHSGPAMAPRARNESEFTIGFNQRTDTSLSPIYPTSFAQLPRSNAMQSAPVVAPPSYADYGGSHSRHNHQSHLGRADISLPPGMSSRSFSFESQAPARSFYGDEARLMPQYQLEHTRRLSSGILPQSPFESSSPPLLTTPYHPPPDIISENLPPSETSASAISSTPGVSYDSDTDIHGKDAL